MEIIFLFLFISILITSILFFFFFIDKAFLDSIIVIISIIGLILNNISKDCPRIENLMKMSTECFVKSLSICLIVAGLLWMSAFFFTSYPYHCLIGITGIISFFVGWTIHKWRKEIEKSQGIAFAIYFFIILVIYIIFFINDPSTQNIFRQITSKS